MSTVKTIRLPRNLVKAIKRWARLEKVDESTAIRQLLAMGVEEFAVKLYKDGKITLNEAAALADLSQRNDRHPGFTRRARQYHIRPTEKGVNFRG